VTLFDASSSLTVKAQPRPENERGGLDKRRMVLTRGLHGDFKKSVAFLRLKILKFIIFVKNGK
jgi:hypothetical protein